MADSNSKTDQDREVSLRRPTAAALWAAEPEATHGVVDDGSGDGAEDQY
jgi:hypothetical protein